MVGGWIGAAWAATATGTVRDGVLHVRVTEDVAALAPSDGRWTIPLPTRAIVTAFEADGPATLAMPSLRGAELTIPPGADTTRVSWTLEIAPFAHGVWLFAADELPVDVVSIDGVDVPVQRGLRVPSDRGAAPAGSLGVVRGGRTVVARLVVDVPARLSPPPPAGLGVVYLVDRSCSQGDEGVRRQLATVVELTRRTPGASHAVLAWDRGVTPLWDGFVAAAEVPATLPLANGTDPAAALAGAGAALAAWPGPRRLVWFTDRLYPSAVDEAALAAALPPETVVHLVITDGHARYGAYWAPTREAPLADLARGGVAGDAVLREPWRVAQALVRPVAVEHVEVVVDGVESEWSLEPLDEGRVVASVVAPPRVPGAVEVRGYTWSEPWSVTAARTPAADDEAARWMWAQPPELPTSVARRLGRHAEVLNPWRSLRSDGRWVRASPREVGIGMGGGGTGAPNPEIAAVDADRVRSILALGGCVGEVELSLELTYDEFTAVEARAADPDLAACVEAAVWGTAIPPGTFSAPRAAGVVSVRPGR